jgi:NAD(P)-dependent dehydrogenase (short-subunit alcohol dehydrogenase family)
MFQKGSGKEMVHSKKIIESFDLSGRVTLVTGGERGLGKAMAEAVAEVGSNVIINYPSSDEKARAEETGKIISGLGVQAKLIQADVTRVEDVENMFGEIDRTFGRLDVLINNAGITSAPAWVHEMSTSDWDRVINVNLRGAFLCMKHALGVMMRQRSGSIINVSSIGALLASDSRFMSIANYSASKAGLLALTRQAAADYASYGIRVNAIALGHHGHTELAASWRKSWSEKALEEYAESELIRTPMGRRGREEELKGLTVFLASEASSYVTGQTIIQDGGYTLR